MKKLTKKVLGGLVVGVLFLGAIGWALSKWMTGSGSGSGGGSAKTTTDERAVDGESYVDAAKAYALEKADAAVDAAGEAWNRAVGTYYQYFGEE